MAEQITYPNLKLEMQSIGALVQEEMIDTLFDNNSVVTFKRSNQFISDDEEGVIGYLKDAYLHQNI